MGTIAWYQHFWTLSRISFPPTSIPRHEFAATVFDLLKHRPRRDHPLGEVTLFSSCGRLLRGRLASVGAIVGGTLALAAACSPVPPVVRVAGPPPAGVVASTPHATTELSK